MIKIYFAALLSITNFITTAQSTLTVSANLDNTIYSELPGNSNGAGDNFTVGTTNGMGIRRALLRFDLSALPAGATIMSATLNLTMNKTVSGAVNISIIPLAAAWGEGTSDAGPGGDGQGAAAETGDATWACSFAIAGGGCATSWATAGGDYVNTASATTSVGGTGSYSWSGSQVAADIQGWLNSPSTNFGWILRSPELTAGTAKRFDSRSSPFAAARPSLSITYTNVVPVSLISFKVQPQKYGALVSWQTAQEINNDYFTIEHSQDGRLFTAIGQVKGTGNSSSVNAYQFPHQLNTPGRHFYRLVQVDINNSKNYSNIATIEFSNRPAALLIAPNPVSEYIKLPGFTGNYTRYQVLSLNGQKIAEGFFSGSEIHLPANTITGLYQLRIFNTTGGFSTAMFQKL